MLPRGPEEKKRFNFLRKNARKSAYHMFHRRLNPFHQYHLCLLEDQLDQEGQEGQEDLKNEEKKRFYFRRNKYFISYHRDLGHPFRHQLYLPLGPVDQVNHNHHVHLLYLLGLNMKSNKCISQSSIDSLPEKPGTPGKPFGPASPDDP